MASSALNKPGTKYGPCVEPCKCKDCACSRKMAESRCTICGEPIGYERHFYNGDKPDTYDHAVCLEEKIEADHKALGKAKGV